MLPAFIDTVAGVSAEQIQSILGAVRRYLAMDVGFISEFTRGNRVFRFTDSATEQTGIVVGNSDPLETTFCHHVVEGNLPGLLSNAQTNRMAAALPATKAFPVGAHLSVPLRHPDGTPYGTICCFSAAPNRRLGTRDLNVLKMCAEVVEAVLEKERCAAYAVSSRRIEIARIIEDEAIEIVFQPLYRVVDERLTGFESLSRFPQNPQRQVDAWFAEAAEIGLGLELEFLAARKALAALPHLDETLKLTINLSYQAILSETFARVLEGVPVHRVVVELTEHAVVDRYETLRQALAPLRARGLRLAIDDVGAGHSTFRHILDLNPEFIKLDRSLIRGLNEDSARRALAEALTLYGRRIGCEVVAEGVETEEELAVIGAIGITRAQGYLLGRPMPLERAVALPAVRTSP